MKPFFHQQRIIDLNPSKYLLNWECRVGKQLPAAIWVDHPCRSGNTYIICIKKNKQSWLDMGTKATVLTKEEFKKAVIHTPTAIVVDEAHKFGSPLFIKGRSQLATSLYTLIKASPDCHVLLLTATPVRQDAWSLHTLLCYIGIYYSWKEWQREFFELIKMPYLDYPAWFPRSDWRKNIKKYLEKHTDIESLKDVIKDYRPPSEPTIVKIKGTKYVRPIDEVVTWIDEHRHEQKGKLAEILDMGYRKMILVVNYTNQIDFLAEALKKEKPVFILDGRTKHAEDVIKQAQEAEECYFIVQASCGEGWDGWMFGAMVFVSMSHSCTAHTQMFGRTSHPHHPNIAQKYYLIGGRWDKRIKDCIDLGKEFNPHIYLHEIS